MGQARREEASLRLGERRRSGAGYAGRLMCERTVKLLITCRDRPGIIAAVTSFISDHGGNVVDVDQHTDRDTGEFFMRLELERESVDVDREGFVGGFGPVVERLGLNWRVEWGDRRKRVAIMASRQAHCLSDLLYRWRTGELDADIPVVISNHEDARGWVDTLGIPYVLLPVTRETKTAQERSVLEVLEREGVDLVVLARYMQVLSPEFVGRYPSRIINIHHSFLPAFAGARPYHQAHARGVKIIGATSHYVTPALDEGPIIAQTAAHVDHRDTVEDLVRTGRDLERVTLAQAVRLHLEDRVLVSGNKTVVFDK